MSEIVSTKSKIQIIKDYLVMESTVCRPSEDVIKKIASLNGLLESHGVSQAWRSSDKKPDLRVPRFSSSRVDSFQSLPSINSTNNSPSGFKNSKSVTSLESLPSRTPTKYVSKYKSTEAQFVEDKILNTIILSKLNKFSSSTYDEIREFLFQILGSQDALQTVQEKKNTEDFVKEFMSLVFKKAASEEIFCPLYAKLLTEISEKYPIILDEMNKLHENYLEIFEECDESMSKNYEEFLQKNREKKYRQGYSQFLAELTSLKILSVDKLMLIYNKIFTQILSNGKQENKVVLIEQYIDCILRITKVLRNKQEQFYVDIRKNLLTNIEVPLTEISNNKMIFISISPKTRFLLMDIQDYLRGI
uniref:MIF4G domain-containing protein n=1 Tax=viral metagenome TaxID=1070528 RepID=A0A6C0D830_9ZZZZ